VAVRYPTAAMMITSRIVGYREMPFKMGRSFEHLIVTDLSREDKDEFARRWCETTELKDRCTQATADLIKAIHSSDRIERLTGNPMLLTTLALVKRKVGKLPTRRADLYREAIEVLLNWRAEVDEPLDSREALPQLEYVAYEMCRRGEQRLREDEIVALLEEVRVNYAHIRPLHKHSAEEFLKILQRRTSILIEVGTEKYDGLLVPVYEFRHLTFQEYLAGLALVRGHFPGHDKTKRLAERIAPLAGITVEKNVNWGKEKEFVVSENWREALRLCIASCNDDDVDEAIEAILTPLPTEDAEKTARPRAVLATLCLADEPNVSEEMVNKVLQRIAQQVDEKDGWGKNNTWENVNTSLDAATMELTYSQWSQSLQTALAREFYQRRGKLRQHVGGICGVVGELSIHPTQDFKQHLIPLIEQLEGVDDVQKVVAAVTIMNIACSNRFPDDLVSSTLDKLASLLNYNHAIDHAVTWAMSWLAINNRLQTKEWTKLGFQAILNCLENQENFTDREAIQRLAVFIIMTEEKPSLQTLVSKLEDDNVWVRRQVLMALMKIAGDEVDRELFLTYFNDRDFWADPKIPIPCSRITRAAKELKLPPEEIQRRYEVLAQQFGLILEWKQ